MSVRPQEIRIARPPAGAITDEATVAALSAHADLEARAMQSLDDVAKARRKVEAVREQDRAEHVAAIRAGGREPDPKKLDQAERAEKLARRQADALMIAARDAANDVAGVVDERREVLEAEAAERVAAAREVMRSAIAELRTAAAALELATRARAWCRQFPKAGSPGSLRLVGLDGPTRDPYTLEQAVAALDVLVDEPARPTDDGPPAQPLTPVWR